MKIRLTSLIIALLVIVQSSSSIAKQPIQIAIVLDDMGNSAHDLLALQLPPAITFAILPYTAHAKKIAHLALQQNRELLLHVPMQAKADNDKLGAGALMLDMQEQEFKEQLRKSIYYLPDATGINNHMGSVLTEQVKQMQWTMEVLDKKGLYFLDSRTTTRTIAESTAKISGIPALRRHIFLDNIKTNEAMERQLQHAINLAEHGSPIVIIAHPYPETIQFLIQKFKQKNTQIELVALQHLLPPNVRLAMSKKRSQWQQVNNIVVTETINEHN